MRSSQAAFNLIVAEEVSSEAAYKKKYRRPEWPGEQSGATIGIGYDLGQTAKATVISDWKGRVSDAMLDAMVSACGATGAAGREATALVKNKIDIPWEVAIAVHKERVVPRWEAKVASALPNTNKLSPGCFGALLSLTFNRGPSFSNRQKPGDTKDRYREMRAIKAHMATEDFAAIPDEFRAMKRLWPNSSGLRKRRDTEAALFAKGLRAIKAPSPTAEEPGRPPRPDPIDVVSKTQEPDDTEPHAAPVDAPKTGITEGAKVAGGLGLAGIASQVWEAISQAPDTILQAAIAAASKPAFWVFIGVLGASGYVWWRRSNMKKA